MVEDSSVLFETIAVTAAQPLNIPKTLGWVSSMECELDLKKVITKKIGEEEEKDDDDDETATILHTIP